MLTESLIALVRLGIPEGIEVIHAGRALEVRSGEGRRFLNFPSGWTVEPHTHGYGGWILSRGRVERFCRVRISPRDRAGLLATLRSEKIDSRSPGAMDFVAEFIGENIALLSFEEQLAGEITKILQGLALGGRSAESRLRQDALFARGVGGFLTCFPAMLNSDQQLPFYRNTLSVDRDFDSGIREAVRDHLIDVMTGRDIPSPIAQGVFTIDPTATGKNEPGTWLTAIKRETSRVGATGEVYTASPDAPVMLLATQPLAGNRKRGPREMGGIKHALPLRSSRDATSGLWNGYEGYLTKEIREAMTRVCVLFSDIPELNVYENELGNLLNLDDILITPDVVLESGVAVPGGKSALTTTVTDRSLYSPDGWEKVKDRYESPDGIALDGVSIVHSPVQETSLKGTPLFRRETVVTCAPRDEQWEVGKILLDSTHKAMVKCLSHALVAEDASGRLYTIEAIVSATSVREKKIESMVLSAVLSRLDFGYVSDPEDYAELVPEARKRLAESGDDLDGLLPIYRLEEDGHRTFVGMACVGFLRACRLQENEQSGTRVREGSAIPLQTPLYNLVRKQAILDPKTEHIVNTLAKTYCGLVGIEESSDESLESGYSARAAAEIVAY